MFLVRKKMSKATRATSLDATLSYLLLILNWFLPTGQNAFVDVFNTTLTCSYYLTIYIDLNFQISGTVSKTNFYPPG